MAWQLENHLSDCPNCSFYVEQHENDTDIIDQTDAAFAVELFLRESVCQPVPEYELLLDMVLMSAATTTLIAPNDGIIVVDNNIKFSWTENTCNLLWLIVENNQYETLFEGSIHNHSLLPLPDKAFCNGIYYYKLINGNDLVKVGKFYVYR